MIFEQGWHGSLTLWDMETRQPVGDPIISGGSLSDLSFNPTGDMIAVSSIFDDAITLWAFSNGSVSDEPLTLEIENPKQLAFSPNGAILASTHGDESITLWDVSSGHSIGEPLTAELGVGGSIAFSDDGQFLASVGTGGTQENDNVITIWDVASQKLVREFRSGTPWPVTQITFSPESHLLASGSRDGTVLLWELDSRHPLATPLSPDADAAMYVTFSPDGTLLASGASDGVVRLWDLASGEEVDSLTISETGGGVNSIAFSPDGKTLIACTWDWGANVALWDLARDVAIGVGLEGHKNEAFSVAFSPTGEVAASSAWDGTIIFWNPKTGEALSEPLTEVSPDEGSSFRSNDIWSIAFSPDGRLLASGRGGGDILIWDVATQKPAGEPFFAHTDTVMAVAISPDGQLLASGGGDWLIRLWEMETGEPVGEPLAGHTDAVIGLEFSPDGNILASGGWDGTIRLWDVAAGQSIGQGIDAGASIISSVAFSPDGTTLATNADPITLWDMKIETWIERACRIANRNLTLEEWRHYLGEMSYHETCPEAPVPDER
jgi:WD40 repeat protein